VNDENKPQGNSYWLKEYGLLLEDKVPCDSKNCEEDAVFYAKTSCCGVVFFACHQCMVDAAKTVELAVKKANAIECIGCKKYVPAKEWLGKPEKLALDTTA
jgi:hypothetical protein